MILAPDAACAARPGLLTAAILAGALLAVGPGAAHGATEPGRQEARLLELINSERTRRGLPELTWERELARLAREHAADMMKMRTATHLSSRDGASFTGRLARSSLRARAAAENVAFHRDVGQVHRGLMASPGHRANILDKGLTAVGIGIARDRAGDSIYVVEDFASPIPSLSDDAAAGEVRAAVQRARSRSRRPPVPEDSSLSRRFASKVKALALEDSVRVQGALLAGSGHVFAYTSTDPAELPRDVARQVDAASGFGVAATFQRTSSFPFGTYWVLIALLDQ